MGNYPVNTIDASYTLPGVGGLFMSKRYQMNRTISKTYPVLTPTTNVAVSKALADTGVELLKTKGSLLVPADLPFVLSKYKGVAGVIDVSLETVKNPVMDLDDSLVFKYPAITPRWLDVVARLKDTTVICAVVPMLEPSMLVTELILRRLSGVPKQSELSEMMVSPFSGTVKGDAILDFQVGCENSGRCAKSLNPWSGEVKLQSDPVKGFLRYRVKGEMGPFTGTKGTVPLSWAQSAAERFLASR